MLIYIFSMTEKLTWSDLHEHINRVKPVIYSYHRVNSIPNWMQIIASFFQQKIGYESC